MVRPVKPAAPIERARTHSNYSTYNYTKLEHKVGIQMKNSQILKDLIKSKISTRATQES